jgi:hypothetical protein
MGGGAQTPEGSRLDFKTRQLFRSITRRRLKAPSPPVSYVNVIYDGVYEVCHNL